MAQTKTRSSRSKSTSGRSGSKSSSRSGSTPKARSRSGSSSSGTRNKSTAKSTARTRKTAGSKSTIATVAEKAKGPALAGGAALVGLAGGMALKNGRKRGVLDRIPTPNLKLSKLSMPDVKPDSALKSIGKAAGEVAQRSHRVGDVASELEKASKAISKKA